MNILRDSAHMQAWSAAALRKGRRVALVPTMGNLHEGHLSLIRIARREADAVVVSLFVNPLQFGTGEDFSRYPRTFDDDADLCRAEGTDLLFAPGADAMYAPDHSTHVVEECLSTGLCGDSRPGHFSGVCTVVARLFHLVQPGMAVFGEKDFQQLRVIGRMVRDLAFPIRMVAAPIVREPDGLAMSSRNRYLTRTERSQAGCLFKALTEARRLCDAGERNADRLREAARSVLAGAPDVRPGYEALVDEETLAPVETLDRAARMLLAVTLGSTRLIDNLRIR